MLEDKAPNHAMFRTISLSTVVPHHWRFDVSKANEEKKGLTGKDKSQGDLVNGGPTETPEGLKRERKGPLDKNEGRNDK